MTTKNETKTTQLGGGAFLRKVRVSNGGDTPAASMAKGILGENSYTATHTTEYNGPVRYRDALFNHYSSNMLFVTGGLRQFVAPDVPSNIKALANLLEKFKQSNFNLAVSAGESRESWHMIANRMFQFAEALNKTRKGDLRGALRALGSTKRPSRRARRKLDTGDVSGSFLELHYGWVPLLRDIYSAAELINKPKIERSSIRTSVHTTGPDVQTYAPEHQGQCSTLNNKRSVYHIAKLSTKEVSWAVRLGLTNPMTILWELTTLSFVADWFLPIGDLISAVEATYILPVGAYVKSDVLRREATLTCPVGARGYGAANTYRLLESTGVYKIKVTTMTRTISAGVPNNIFDGSGPRQSLIDLDLSLSQIASASALLHQAFRAFRR